MVHFVRSPWLHAETLFSCQHLVRCRHLDCFLRSYTHHTAPSETKCRQREKQEAQESLNEQSKYD